MVSKAVEADTFYAFTTLISEIRDVFIRNLEEEEEGESDIGLYVLTFHMSIVMIVLISSPGILNIFQRYVDYHIPTTAEHLVHSHSHSHHQ